MYLCSPNANSILLIAAILCSIPTQSLFTALWTNSKNSFQVICICSFICIPTCIFKRMCICLLPWAGAHVTGPETNARWVGAKSVSGQDKPVNEKPKLGSSSVLKCDDSRSSQNLINCVFKEFQV